MAGSFDSHFARHNMMWQCQLSQPDCRCYRVDGYSLLKRLPLHPLIGPRCPLQSVGQWLDSIGLVQYENHLLANGFDNVQFMVSVFIVFWGKRKLLQAFSAPRAHHVIDFCAGICMTSMFPPSLWFFLVWIYWISLFLYHLLSVFHSSLPIITASPIWCHVRSSYAQKSYTTFLPQQKIQLQHHAAHIRAYAAIKMHAEITVVLRFLHASTCTQRKNCAHNHL